MAASREDVKPTEMLSTLPLSSEIDAPRIREVHKYYEPFQTPSSISTPVDAFRSANGLSKHRPRPSSDKVLTALCQLTAIRLGGRRALLVLFDGHQGFVLAEATKSLSLQRDGRSDVGDELWLGCCSIPKGLTVCENTHIHASRSSSVPGSNTNGQVDLVADLRMDPRYSDCAYVKSHPAARFYAGIAIAPRELNIGVLCLLDDRPRDGLTADEIDFMVGMSTTVSGHLETVRGYLQYQRSVQVDVGSSVSQTGPDKQAEKESSSQEAVQERPVFLQRRNRSENDGKPPSTKDPTPRHQGSRSPFDTSSAAFDTPNSALSFIHPMMQQLQQIRADAHTPPSLPQGQSTLSRIRNLDILIVDDNEIHMQLLQMYCQQQGHRSQAATDGQRALGIYTAAALANVDASLSTRYTISGSDIQRLNGCPQVVLVDINTPANLVASQQIRAFETKMGPEVARRKALIVAMAGNLSREARQQAVDSGIDVFIQKPVKLAALTEVLEEKFASEAS